MNRQFKLNQLLAVVCCTSRTLFAGWLVFSLPQGLATGAEIAVTPVYGVAEIVFVGPSQSAKDAPARDVQFAVTFQHENGSPELTVHGFFDGDGRGGIEGDVFKVRFCPTLPGQWTVVDVKSNAREIAGQHRGDYVSASPSELHGFWVVDDENSGGHWYRRSDGSHQYIFGNTHYTFLTEHGLGGKPTGGHIAEDMTANAKYFNTTERPRRIEDWLVGQI